MTRTLTPTRTSTPTATATTEHNTYCPDGLHGQINQLTSGVSGVSLSLRMYDTSSESTVATTVTDSAGRYCFTGAPGLSTGQTYYVLFGPNSTDERFVSYWFGPDVSAYAAGTRQAGGDFAIADVRQTSPEAGANVTLPATFTWQRRALAGETYRWALSDDTGRDLALSEDLGDVGTFRLTSLPQGLSYGRTYWWYARAYQGPGSFGLSYYVYGVTFSPPAGAARAAQRSQQPHVMLRGDLPKKRY